MTRIVFLGCLLSLVGTLAVAQDEQGQPPALSGLGAALEAASQARVLEGLPVEQSFRVEGEGNDGLLMMVMARTRPRGGLKLGAAAFLSGGRVSLEEHDLSQGLLVGSERKVRTLSGSGARAHWRGVVQKGVLTMRAGREQHPDVPLRAGTLPLPVALFVLPSIADQLDAGGLLPFECPVLVDVDRVLEGSLVFERAPAEEPPRDGALPGERIFALRHPALGRATVYVAGGAEARGRILGVRTFKGTWLESIPQAEAKRLLKAEMNAEVDAARGNLADAQQKANETVAVDSLLAIARGQLRFRELDKEGDGVLDYAVSLHELFGAGLLDPVLAGGVKQGYRFEVCHSTAQPEFKWMAVASPVNPGVSGSRHFAINHEGQVRFSTEPFALDREACAISAGIPIGQ